MRNTIALMAVFATMNEMAQAMRDAALAQVAAETGAEWEEAARNYDAAKAAWQAARDEADALSAKFDK